VIYVCFPETLPLAQKLPLKYLGFLLVSCDAMRLSPLDTSVTIWTILPKYSRLSIIRAWFNRFAAQPRQCIFKEKILFSVSIAFV
jgi:hypothetical protein